MRAQERSDGNLAEFETIIERILSADNKAKELAEKAEQEKQEAIRHIDEQKVELRSKYSERANRRIEILREQEESFTAEKIESECKRQQQRLDALNETAKRNMDAWVEELYRGVIHG